MTSLPENRSGPLPILLGITAVIHFGAPVIGVEPVKKELETVTHQVGGGITEEIKRTAYVRGNRTVLVLETSKVTLEREKKVLTNTDLLFPVSKTEFARVPFPKPFVNQVVGGDGLVVNASDNYVRVYNLSKDYFEHVDFDGANFKLIDDETRTVMWKTFKELKSFDLKHIKGLELPD